MNRLKEIRYKFNKNAYEMADMLGITARTYYNIENGISYLDERMIKIIHDEFYIPSDYILGFNGDYDIPVITSEKDKLTNTIINIFKE